MRDTSFGCPRRRERAGIERAAAQHLLRRGTLGFGFFEVGLEIGGHLVGDRVRDVQPFPFAAALLDELVHAPTSASTRTEHGIERVACRAPLGHAGRERDLARARSAVVLARRPAPLLAARYVSTRPSRSKRPSSG